MKTKLRRSLSAARDAIPAAERSALSAELCSLISAMPEFTAAECLLIYCPIASEPELLPLAEKAYADGKSVAFPKIDGRKLVFIKVNDTSSLKPGRYGIPEPDDGAGERVTAFAKTLCVVPALAADKQGSRLGYGGGYYDRFLNNYDGFSVCGVFPQLVREDLPREPHDVCVNALAIAGEGVIRF
ncbi:MAG: 5-formyltetrahydrofolate cyclo-ligase [Clostridia bacterium]|nr:5-formyltetrahydrofolate cyclo-ligase [Clostridia bacterium]